MDDSNNSFRQTGVALGKWLGTNLAAHCINEIFDKCVNYIAHRMHSRNRETLLPAGRDGHAHTYAAMTAGGGRAASSSLASAYDSYAAYADAGDPYHAFYANYWAGLLALLRGDRELGVAHLKDAYYNGERFLNRGSAEARYDNRGEWDHRYDVAAILDTVGPPLGLAPSS